jgi:orotidine-5'-phosphate decarboxylase
VHETLTHPSGHFADRLIRAIRGAQTPAMVGIDPRPERLPSPWNEAHRWRDAEHAGITLMEYGRELVDVVAGKVAVVKPQSAFFEAYGPHGSHALHAVCRHAHEAGLLVILDGKRNDIGSTAEAYAQAYVGQSWMGRDRAAVWPIDALTVNPYLGSDGIFPFLDAAEGQGRGVFALVRTSNPSAGEIQDLMVHSSPLYRHVAQLVTVWGSDRGEFGYSRLGAVVGATHPEALAELRAEMPGILFLVPGYGAQGGSAADVAPAFLPDGLGAIVNSSRGITEAHLRGEFQARARGDWQRAVEFAIEEMIAALAADTPAGKLRAKT